MLSPGIPRSCGGTPKASAISRAELCLDWMKSISLGERLISFQSSPPSNSSGLPALMAPVNCSSIWFLTLVNCSSLSTPPLPSSDILTTSAPLGFAPFWRRAWFHTAALLCWSILYAAASMGDIPYQSSRGWKFFMCNISERPVTLSTGKFCISLPMAYW